MVYTNFPNGLTSFGVPLPASGFPQSNANYWFVNSVTGSNGNTGASADNPFATLAYACQLTALSAGDTIIVMEGHSENVTAAGTTSTGILLSKAGVNVYGYGAGSTATPTFNFTTATTATFKITGAGVTVQGLKFVNGINSLVTMLDIQAKGVMIAGCRFVEGTSTTGLSFIDLVNATANAADGLKLLSNHFYNPTAGNMNHAIGLTTVQDNVEIGAALPGEQGNYIVGQFALSGIHNITGKVMTNLNIHDNYVRNLTAAKVALNMISASTGQAYRNTFEPGDNTVNSAKFGTALDASGGNIGINGRLDAGQEFVLTKTGVVSSTITTTGVDMTVASIGGPIAITGWILKTDGTGLAAATNFLLTTNNANGVATFATVAVSALGANATIAGGINTSGTASSTGAMGTVLENGKKITLKATVTNCTGAGTIDIHLICRRLTAGADVSLV